VENVRAGGQASRLGVKKGWKIILLEGDPYRVEMLDLYISGRESYHITFELPSDPFSGFLPPKPPSTTSLLGPSNHVPISTTTRKRRRKCVGLFIGILYPNTKGRLRGCANDVKAAINMIQRVFGVEFTTLYLGCDISEYRENPERKFDIRNFGKIPKVKVFEPTKRNIEKYYVRALRATQDDEMMWMHYSGHGTSKYDYGGDEDDRRDEVLCPCDQRRAGVVSDDWLMESLETVNPNINLIACFDACHSGTMLDVDRIKQANVVTFSGCQDDQTSADMSPSNPFMAPYGAFTTSMVRAVMADGKVLDRDLQELGDAVNGQLRGMKVAQRSRVLTSKSTTLREVMYISNKRSLDFSERPNSKRKRIS